MSEVHLVVGVSLIGLNLLAAAWGGVAWLRDHASIAFWYMLRAAQVSVFIQVTLGALLVVTGHEAADGLHYLYGFLPLPVSLFAEAARTGAVGDLEAHGGKPLIHHRGAYRALDGRP